VARNRAEKERGELRENWMQTNTEFETFKANFNDCQERDDMSLRVQAELESRIEQHEQLYKEHMMLESELAEAKAKGKVVRNSQTDEINLLKRELNNEKIRLKYLEVKNKLMKHHNKMTDINNNQLNRSNMLLSEKMSNMDEQND
jgi:disulfide oxidoreductase YuzD